jgi:hypothetical protein
MDQMEVLTSEGARALGSIGKTDNAAVVTLRDAGSFDCVPLVPHFAQDDHSGRSGTYIDLANFISL